MKSIESMISEVALTESISLDFWQSSSLAELENGIKNSWAGVRISILAIGISLARIEAEKLYEQKGFKSLTEYLRSGAFVNIPKSTLSEYKKIGRIYLEHREDLRMIDFNEKMGVKKLLFLDDALKGHPEEKQDVLKRLKNESYSNFRLFSKTPAGERRKNMTVPYLKGALNFVKKVFGCRTEMDVAAVKKQIEEIEKELMEIRKQYGLVKRG